MTAIREEDFPEIDWKELLGSGAADASDLGFTESIHDFVAEEYDGE